MASRTTAYSSSRRAMRSCLRLAGWALLSAAASRAPRRAGRVGSIRDSPELSGRSGLAGFLEAGNIHENKDMTGPFATIGPGTNTFVHREGKFRREQGPHRHYFAQRARGGDAAE